MDKATVESATKLTDEFDKWQAELTSLLSDLAHKDGADGARAEGLGQFLPTLRAAIAKMQSEKWTSIESAPEDKNILVATAGGHVDAAFWTDEDGEGRKWWWLVSANEYAKHPIHENLIPTHWMKLPAHPKD